MNIFLCLIAVKFNPITLTHYVDRCLKITQSSIMNLFLLLEGIQFPHCYEITVAVTTTQVRRSSSSHITIASLWVFLISGLLFFLKRRKNTGSLWDCHVVCCVSLYLCVPHFNLWNRWTIFNKCGTNVMPLEATQMPQFFSCYNQ
jgi:hypothetical protein